MKSTEQSLILAVDLGGTHVELGLVDAGGRVLVHETHPTGSAPTPRAFVDMIVAARPRLEEIAGRAASGVGIGAPNGNHRRGTIEFAPNLTWEGRVPLAELVTQATGLPTELDNDANLAALGEGHFGSCAGLDDFVVVTLGTGIGAGIVSGGTLVRGASGFAGELGHLTAVPGGRPCACGSRGCVEAYVSGAGLGVTYAELASAQNQPTKLLDARELHAAAIAGDPFALETFERSGELFAVPLAAVTLLLAPARIVFIGGLTRAGDLLLKPIRRHYARSLPTSLEPAPLSFEPDSQAALAGARALFFDKRNE